MQKQKKLPILPASWPETFKALLEDRCITARIIVGLFLILPLTAAGADDATTDIGTVRANGTGGTPIAAPGSAPAAAPSQPPLSASQPTSVVGPDYIRNNAVPTESYDNIIKFTPSATNVEPAGAGLQQNFAQTIRGFNYTQFNSTFDGLVLPGTISNFAPQTGAYFLAHAIDSVSVDRGPGTASQIGYATFGGTVAATLASPSDKAGVNPYLTVGSFGVVLEGLRLDTGAVPQAGGARGLFDFSHLEGDGYPTGTSTIRNNAYTKIEAPVGTNTVITFVGMYNYARTHTPYGATLDQLRRFGANYALNGDPRSQAFTGYNVDNYYTDFDYIGIKSALDDGWTIDDKIYTISYFHNGTQGGDPNGPRNANGLNGTFIVGGVPRVLSGDIPGIAIHSDFRAWGNVLRVSKDTNYGQLRFGLWTDYNVGSSYRANIDFSAGDASYTTSAVRTPFLNLYHTSLTTVQPYIEFAAKPLPGLTITPGLKYTYVDRGLDAKVISSAVVGPGNLPPSSQSWDALQPAIDAHYEIMKDWVAYAQVARGFLAPQLNTILVTSANVPTNLKPQTTMNYQIGTAFHTDRFSLGLDAYYIKFNNYITSRTNVSAGGTQYFNAGDATFKGIEAEGTVKLIPGVFVYGNATLNDATFDASGYPVILTPRRTGAIGPIIQREDFYTSFLWKYVGPQYTTAGTSPTVHASDPIKSYTDADFSVGYRLALPKLNDRSLNFRFNVVNVFNNHSLIGNLGANSAGQTLFVTNPGRGAFLTISASL